MRYKVKKAESTPYGIVWKLWDKYDSEEEATNTAKAIANSGHASIVEFENQIIAKYE